MRRTRIAALVALTAFLAGCGESLLLYNASTGNCDRVPKAMAYAMGGAIFAATRNVDAWRCEGLKDGDKARMEKPP